MKKIIGLSLVAFLLSTVSVFAQDGRRDGKRAADHTQRWEQTVRDLNLNENQAAEYRRIENQYKDRLYKDNDNRKDWENLTQEQRDKHRQEMERVMDERNNEVKKILSDDQYRNYLEKQKTYRNEWMSDGKRNK